MTSDASTPKATLNVSDVPPPGLSPRSALRAVQERNLRVENENVFLQEQLNTIKTLMENDKEARERDRLEMAKHRAAMEQERASLELDKEMRERDRLEMARYRAAMEQERASLELLR